MQTLDYISQSAETQNFQKGDRVRYRAITSYSLVPSRSGSDEY